MVSFAIAARDHQLSDAQAQAAVMECTRAYREHLHESSQMSPLDVWYERMDMETLIEAAPDAKARRVREQIAAKARQHVIEHLFPKIASEAGGRLRLVDQPPVLFHVAEADWRSGFKRDGRRTASRCSMSAACSWIATAWKIPP